MDTGHVVVILPDESADSVVASADAAASASAKQTSEIAAAERMGMQFYTYGSGTNTDSGSGGSTTTVTKNIDYRGLPILTANELSLVNSNVKYTFFAYNGIATVYKTQATSLGFSDAQAKNGEGSPYVMNRADAKRDPTVEPTKSNNTWGQIKTDNGSLSYPANTDYGAYVVYCAL